VTVSVFLVDLVTGLALFRPSPLPFFLDMEKQHLTYFKIENVKRFDSFEMSNLGQFNLIGMETT